MFYTDFGCTTTEDFCVTYLVFSFVDFFSFALSLSFLDSLYFATLELSFSLSLLSVSFYANPALLHLLAAKLKRVEAVGLSASCPALPTQCQIVT